MIRLARLGVLGLLCVLGGCASRSVSTDAPMTGAWSRQLVGGGPGQQGVIDLTSLPLDTGATVMYGGDDGASPIYALEFGAEHSFWRVEEFEPRERVDLGRIQSLIDELHNTSLRIVRLEIDRWLAESAAQRRMAELTEVIRERPGGAGAHSGDETRADILGSLLEHRHAMAKGSAEGVMPRLRDARAHADAIERELTQLLSGENVLVLRWNTGSDQESGYAVLSGLRRVRLVLGRDFARGPAFPSINGGGRLTWDRSTGVVTTALQAREIVYLSRRDVGASVGDLLSGADAELARSLSDEGVIGVNAAVAAERQRFSGLVSRGRLGQPRRYAVRMNWRRFLSGELPPAFSADSMADDGRWITFGVAATQLGVLRRAGRLD
ncbi:MAG: hypothetical protein ACIARR_07935 [Phycisphaerales bacterium JB059]